MLSLLSGSFRIIFGPKFVCDRQFHDSGISSAGGVQSTKSARKRLPENVFLSYLPLKAFFVAPERGATHTEQCRHTRVKRLWIWILCSQFPKLGSSKHGLQLIAHLSLSLSLKINNRQQGGCVPCA